MTLLSWENFLRHENNLGILYGVICFCVFAWAFFFYSKVSSGVFFLFCVAEIWVNFWVFWVSCWKISLKMLSERIFVKFFKWEKWCLIFSSQLYFLGRQSVFWWITLSFYNWAYFGFANVCLFVCLSVTKFATHCHRNSYFVIRIISEKLLTLLSWENFLGHENNLGILYGKMIESFLWEHFLMINFDKNFGRIELFQYLFDFPNDKYWFLDGLWVSLKSLIKYNSWMFDNLIFTYLLFSINFALKGYSDPFICIFILL